MSTEQEKKETQENKTGSDRKSAETKNENVQHLTWEVEALMQTFINTEGLGGNLTANDRRRLVGIGVRNNGFIDKAFDIARDNPQFMPAHFNVGTVIKNMTDLENLRQLLWTLQQFLQVVNNAFMIHADSCYRDALRIYSALQEQTRNKVDGAEPLFRALATFFSRTRRQPADEPTEMELERDINRLIHGKADGEIVIKNESPHVQGGMHEVIDSVHKDRSAFKGTAEGEIRE
jgi:hypothetical protein